jgi:hypothetical protein
MQLFKYGKAEIDHLKSRDRKLGRAIDRIGMIERQVTPDLFEALVHSVVAQQISSKAAATVWGLGTGVKYSLSIELDFEFVRIWVSRSRRDGRR